MCVKARIRLQGMHYCTVLYVYVVKEQCVLVSPGGAALLGTVLWEKYFSSGDILNLQD